MFLRHNAIYFLARGGPGIIGFVTIIVFTRLLSPEAYGEYALVVSTAILVNALLYQWLNGSLLRFMPQYRDDQTRLLTALFGGFICVSLLCGVAGLILVLALDKPGWSRLVLISVLLIWAQAWFTINLELARSRLMPARYGLMSSFKALVALALGSLLVWSGGGAYGAIAGLIAGYMIPGAWALVKERRSAEWKRFEPRLVKSVLAYGLPLTASYALNAVTNSTDRFMLASLIDESAAGLYVAGQVLTQQTIGVFMIMVNLAAYPLVVTALETKGEEAARVQLRKNAMMLLTIGLPLTSGFILLAGDIARVFLGREFQEAAAILIPWAALAALLSGLRAYYFDMAFYLGRQTRVQVIVMTIAALTNVILNFYFIPVYGMVGSAYASVIAHGTGLTLSVILGRQAFRLPRLYSDVAKLLLSTLCMAGGLLLLPHRDGLTGLLLMGSIAGFIYLICVLTVDAGNARATLLRIVGQWQSKRGALISL